MDKDYEYVLEKQKEFIKKQKARKAELALKKKSVEKQNPFSFKLIGDNMKTLYLGEKFIEPGAIAIDESEKDISSNINIINNINYYKKGIYYIEYKINSQATGKEYFLLRTIIIKNKSIPKIKLIGDNPMEIYEGENFIEPGAIATDEIDGNITKLIEKVNLVDENTRGKYKIIYNVKNTLREITKTERIIIVKKKIIIKQEVITDVEKITPPKKIINSPKIDLIVNNTDEIDRDITNNIFHEKDDTEFLRNHLKKTELNSVDPKTPGIYKIIYSITNTLDEITQSDIIKIINNILQTII